jgi:Plasma-membrane choline transporter
MLEYFNKWAFVYIGLYGYSFWEAGPKVLELFSNRGWSTIIDDPLISHVLADMSLIIGLLNGVLAEIIVALFPSSLNVEGEVEDDGVEAIIGIPFLVGSFIGFMVSHLLLSVISSAVDTVLVCFAEAPMELRQYHPLLFEQMDHVWRDKFSNSPMNTVSSFWMQ